MHRFDLRPAIVAVTLFAAGGALFVWGTGRLRGFGGDVGVIVLFVALLAALRIGSPRTRILGVLAVAGGTEIFQSFGLIGKDAPWWLHLTLGSTFDPLDLLAYAIGGALATVAERLWTPTDAS